MDEAKREGDTCPNCGGSIAIRNPTEKCDHLHYPENVPGYVSERSALIKCEAALREARTVLPWLADIYADLPDHDPGVAATVEACRRTIVSALSLLDEAPHGK